jgi:two-component system, chemotaxis family, sensor kinase CheA
MVVEDGWSEQAMPKRVFRMNLTDVKNQIDQIAQTLVLVEPDALETLDGLPELFGDLAAVLMEMGREDEAAASRHCAAIGGQLAGGELDWESALDVLGRTLNALQACLNDDCSASEAGFPAELVDGVTPAVASEDEAVEQPTEAVDEPVTQVVETTEVVESHPSSACLADDGIMSEFLARQADTLDEVEKMLMSVEQGESEGDLKWILRFFHTLKGESGLLGMSDVADLCHATEDMMQGEDLHSCIDRLLHVKDWFVTTFKHISEEGPTPAPLQEMLDLLKIVPEKSEAPVAANPVEDTVAPEPESIAEPAAEPVAEPVVAEVVAVDYEVADYTSKNVQEGDVELVQDFIEEAIEHLDASEGHLLAIEEDPSEAEALNAVFRGFHTIKGLAGFIELDHVKVLAHNAENLLDMARRDELQLVGDNMDLVFESVDMMKRLVEGLGVAMEGDGHLKLEETLPTLIGRLVAVTDGAGSVAAAPAPAPEPVTEPEPEPVADVELDKDAVLAKAKVGGFVPLGKMPKKIAAKPVEEKTPEAPVAKAPAAAAVAAPEAAGGVGPAKSKTPIKIKEAMRVDAERLDRLIETIGELVIAESMVTQSPELKGSAMSVKMAKDVDHLDKICRELQEIGMSLRMVPVRPVFQKMARLVRDLAKKTNRKVDFVMNGEDTELDKNVVDKIGDPLVHMVRNSVDHGIEADSDERLKLGKPERGRVELRAFHKGGNICIEIEDDGKGLDKEAIRSKAISRGLLREGENISDRDLFNLIFEPGFSTAKKVTDVSGRGVGMDVVRRNIEELRGVVDISSEVGKGSVFSIRLPLTLAIIEGMVIMVGSEHYIIPTLSVVRLIRPKQSDINHVFDKGEMLAFEGGHLPLFRLSTLFDITESKKSPEEAVVVVVEEEGRKIAVMADELLGQQSIVIKSLGESIQGTDGVAGGAIMSDGNVALILDIAGLVRVAHQVDTSVLTANEYKEVKVEEVPQVSAPKADHDQELFDAIAAEVADHVATESAIPAPVEV